MCDCGCDGKGKKLILVVDDDEDYTKAAELVLADGGYDTAVVHSGEECRKYLETGKPDAILLDMMMETWSEGNNVVSHLRSNPQTKDIPIVLASAVDFRSAVENTPESEDDLDVEGYMAKPIDPEKLLKLLENVISTAEHKRSQS